MYISKNDTVVIEKQGKIRYLKVINLSCARAVYIIKENNKTFELSYWDDIWNYIKEIKHPE